MGKWPRSLPVQHEQSRDLRCLRPCYTRPLQVPSSRCSDLTTTECTLPRHESRLRNCCAHPPTPFDEDQSEHRYLGQTAKDRKLQQTNTPLESMTTQPGQARLYPQAHLPA